MVMALPPLPPKLMSPLVEKQTTTISFNNKQQKKMAMNFNSSFSTTKNKNRQWQAFCSNEEEEEDKNLHVLRWGQMIWAREVTMVRRRNYAKSSWGGDGRSYNGASSWGVGEVWQPWKCVGSRRVRV